ncbi:MAG: 3-oxoacyl-ACP reductase FabG [Oscillospiraceae bacterium]|nr:3-oxoacyl-ACP reductase FabG [Candidatus Equicaccousia limihippi]
MAKTVIITGSSQGIGAACAVEFAQKGYNVVINYNNSETLARNLCDSLKNSGAKCIAIGADVTYTGEVESLVKQTVSTFGGIDILVNNAGIARQQLVQDISDRDWNEIIGVNLTGTFNVTRAVVPYMLSKKEGSIVNVSSMWGQVGASMESAYSAAKAGVIGFTKALAKELGPSGIRVNCVCPGVIETRMNRNLTIETIEQLSDDTPIGRLGTPQEVAAAIRFLADDNAAFITGQILGVNGGIIN